MTSMRTWLVLAALWAFAALPGAVRESAATEGVPAAVGTKLSFPKGTATPSEVCGECHKAIYREYALGFGSDLHYQAIPTPGVSGKDAGLPENVSSTATSHALAGVDPFPMHAREAEAEGKSCNVCHFPEAFNLPDLQVSEVFKPKPRP
ncbi:MAG TPA: hypothetical protein VIU40_04500, partial [Geobacteraceae bacterium]